MKTHQHKLSEKSDELVITVNHLDVETGVMHKMDAHINGVLHRAFSVFVFNSKKELLLQKRAKDKYHSGGLWTNTCCSHPRPGENTHEAAQRRLFEEMGIHCDVSHAFSFIYQASFDNNMHEHELDHLFIGNFDGTPVINDAEVEDWKFQSLRSIRSNLLLNPDDYTVWFKICFDKVEEFLKQKN